MLERGVTTQEPAVRPELIAPHGGTLINRIATDADPLEQLATASTLPVIDLDARAVADIECIATGIYSPLTGFAGRDDYDAVIDDMRLANGLPWTIPVTLSIADADARRLQLDQDIALSYRGKPLATMTVTDIFLRDKQREASNVYGTTEAAHPGVAAVYESGDICIGGPITMIDRIPHDDFFECRLTPAETRAEFAHRGWRSVVAFQTRNPIHRAHEYLQKVALEIVDGLFVNPLVGTTKGDDVPATVRMRTYEVILGTYYPVERTLLSVYPAAMRYAGPREAIMHAISRKNYGCTHFIVGRDHAGVGNYYGTYAAQEIFDRFEPSEIGILPLKFEHSHFCSKCGQLVTSKTCPHGQEHWVHLSGTKVRELLSNGELPPPEFSRPEVAAILIEAYAQANGAAK